MTGRRKDGRRRKTEAGRKLWPDERQEKTKQRKREKEKHERKG